MSGSYIESKRLPLGLGDLFINNIWVGSLKGKVVVNDKITYAEQQPGNMLSPVKAERIKEDVTLTAEICDFKVEQLRRALGINQAIDSSAVTLRVGEQIKLSGVIAATLGHTPTGNYKVSKLDRSTVYVSGTDYTAATNVITRKVGGVITAGQIVMVEYSFSDATAKSVIVGGEQTTPNTFDMVFVHTLSDGKHLQVEFFKAYSMTDFMWTFNEKSGGVFSTYNVTFKALVDLTKKEGQNLWKITEEAGSATVN